MSSMLASAHDFEWMSSGYRDRYPVVASPSKKKRRSYLLNDEPEYEEEIQFTRRRTTSGGKAKSPPPQQQHQPNTTTTTTTAPAILGGSGGNNDRDRDRASSPLMNFKLLDLTSFDDHDEIGITGSCSTDGAMVDPAEVPFYDVQEGPFGRSGQDAWIRCNHNHHHNSNHHPHHSHHIHHNQDDEDWSDLKSTATATTAISATTGITATTTGVASQASNNSKQWDNYKDEDIREDPDCEYFDLTALGSDEDVTMATTATRSSSTVGIYHFYADQGGGGERRTDDQRDTAATGDYGRFLSSNDDGDLDEFGNHPSDYYDLTVLSNEEVDAFDRVFNMVSKVKQQQQAVATAPYDVEPTPFELDIVDLTANSDPDTPIVDLTSLTGDGPEEEQLTENGSVIVDLTHVQLEDEYRDDHPWQVQNATTNTADPLLAVLGTEDEYQDPFPSLPDNPRSYESYISQGGSCSSNNSSYRGSRSFDWMTRAGATSPTSFAQQPAVQPIRPSVRWLDQVTVDREQELAHPVHPLTNKKEPRGSAKTSQPRDPDGAKNTDDHHDNHHRKGEEESPDVISAGQEEEEVDEDTDTDSDSDTDTGSEEASEDEIEVLGTVLETADCEDKEGIDKILDKDILGIQAMSDPRNRGFTSTSNTKDNTDGAVGLSRSRSKSSSPTRERSGTRSPAITDSSRESSKSPKPSTKNVSVADLTGGTSFLDILFEPAAVACNAAMEKHLMKDSSKKREARNQQQDKKNEGPRHHGESQSHHQKDDKRLSKHHNIQSGDDLHPKGDTTPEHYDLTQANSILDQSKSQDDDGSEGPSIKEQLEKCDLNDWCATEPSKDSVIKRERIEKLRMQRKKRQQVLSTFLDGGSQNGTEEGGEEVTALEREVQSGVEVEVPLVEKPNQEKGEEEQRLSISKEKMSQSESSASNRVAAGSEDRHKVKKKNKDKKKKKSKDKKGKGKGKEKGKKGKKKKKRKKDKEGKKKRDTKNKKKQKTGGKAKENPGIVMTWKRVKATLTPTPWKKRDVALFTPSSSEEDDTDHDNKLRREEVRQSIERAAFENVRISRSSSMRSDKLSLAHSASSKQSEVTLGSDKSPSTKNSKKIDKAKKSLKSSRKVGRSSKRNEAGVGPQYDGDADTNSEHETRRKAYQNHHGNDTDQQLLEDQRPQNIAAEEETDGEASNYFLERTIEGGILEMERLNKIDMQVHQQTAAAAQAAIAIAAASREEIKSSRVSFLEGERNQSFPKEQPVLRNKSSDSGDYDTDDGVDEGPGNFYLAEKDGSQASRDHYISNMSSSFYSTDYIKSDEDDKSGVYSFDEGEEEAKSYRSGIESNPSMASRTSVSSKSNKSTKSVHWQTDEPHSTSIVPQNPVIIVDPYRKRVENGTGHDVDWLYGTDVNLPVFLSACMHCPTVAGTCCDIWQSAYASPETDEHAKKGNHNKSSSDSHTYTTVGASTANTPITCSNQSVECIDDSTLKSNCNIFSIGDSPTNPFCNDSSRSVDQSCCSVDMLSANPAETDTETNPSPPPPVSISSTINLVYNACGVATHIKRQGQDGQSHIAVTGDDKSFQPPVLPISCGRLTVVTEGEGQDKNVVAPDQCGAFQSSARDLNSCASDSLLGRCISPSRGRSRKPKRSGDSVSSKSKRRGRRAKRRHRHREDEDSIEDTVSYSFELRKSTSNFENQSEAVSTPDTKRSATYDGVVQATEDALAMLSKQASIEGGNETTNALRSGSRSLSPSGGPKVTESRLAEERRLDESKRSGESGIKSSMSDRKSASSENKSAVSDNRIVRSVRKREQGSARKDNSDMSWSTGRPANAAAAVNHHDNNQESGSTAPDASVEGSRSSQKMAEGSMISSPKSQAKSAEGSLTSSRKSLMEASRNSSLFTPDDFEDISLGYSDSNMDAWSFDGGSFDANAPDKGDTGISPPRLRKEKMKLSAEGKDDNSSEEDIGPQEESEQAKEAKATLPLPSKSQPISNFVMSIFGQSADDTPSRKTDHQVSEQDRKQSLKEAMERPQSLKSLASYSSNDSDDELGGTASDRSMSSLSLSLNDAKKPSSSLDRRRLEELVSELMAHPYGILFSSPVSLKDFPDYYRVIKKPMDLGTVLRKLLSAGYPNLLDFHADVSLTFENAMEYNAEGTKVHEMALELKDIFEENFLLLLDALEAELREKEEEARMAI